MSVWAVLLVRRVFMSLTLSMLSRKKRDRRGPEALAWVKGEGRGEAGDEKGPCGELFLQGPGAPRTGPPPAQLVLLPVLLLPDGLPRL